MTRQASNADGIERVEMKTDTLRMTVLPALGGKIASLWSLRHNVELLQQPLAPYALPAGMTLGFEESDASGFDECLPSVSACVVETPSGPVSIPDHGDFWRLPCAWEHSGRQLHLSADGTSLPLRFWRTLSLEGDTLSIDYRVRNEGALPVEYIWSAHPLFAVDEGDRLLLPPSVERIQVENSAGERLGKKGAVHSWPRTISSQGEPVDLSLAGSLSDGTGDKLFANAPPEGWAAIERRRSGLRLHIEFDALQLPFLGLWLCYGGWPESGKNRQHCIAVEPCTASADSLAEAVKNRTARTLPPGGSDSWKTRIYVVDVS